MDSGRGELLRREPVEGGCEEGLWREAVERGCGKRVCRVLLQSGCGEWLPRGAGERCHDVVPQSSPLRSPLRFLRCIFGHFGDDLEELRC